VMAILKELIDIAIEHDYFHTVFSEEILSTIIPAINSNIRMLLQDMLMLPAKVLELLMVHQILLRYRSNLQYMIILLYVAGANPRHFVEDKKWNLDWYCHISEVQQSEMAGICSDLKTVAKEMEDEMAIEIPDQFLDPLFGTLIQEPCLLPSMPQDQFMDKYYVLKQIMINEENPYTREKLSIEDFVSWNEQPEIQAKIDAFKSELNQWKKTNWKNWKSQY